MVTLPQFNPGSWSRHVLESRINFIFIINTFLRFPLHRWFLVRATYFLAHAQICTRHFSVSTSFCLIIVIIYYSETICYADFLQKYNLCYSFSRSPPKLPVSDVARTPRTRLPQGRSYMQCMLAHKAQPPTRHRLAVADWVKKGPKSLRSPGLTIF